VSARDRILGAIAGRLNRPLLDPAARDAAEARIAAHQRNTVPARGQLPPRDRIDLFVRKAEAVGCTVERLAEAEIPAAIARYLAQHNQPARLRVAPDPLLTGLPWDKAPMLTVESGTTKADDMAGLALGVAGVAETGTLVLRSGADAPTALNFTPDTHLVVLRADAVVAGYEDAFDRVRAAAGAAWPRTVNFITGPSRTADIEQTLIMGAHGPRRLHVLLVEDAPAA
jgi:L-lactate dehydrogenase complex protein LldG